jgi:hypothetical protein
MSLKNIYEVFEEFEKAKTKEEKVYVLRKNATYALREVLRGTFNPNIRFFINEVPQYKPSDAPIGLGYSSIHQELGRAYLFELNNPKVAPTLTENRKKQILIQILETLEAKESEIFVNMLLKKQEVKGLTPAIVKEAFPDILP